MWSNSSDLPLPVQPMKAISAVILTGGLRPGEVAAAGIMIGVVLLVLGITGWIGRLARANPQSVSAGLQLGLGLLMGVLGLELILETPWLGFGSLVLLFALTRVPRCPAAPLALAAVIVAGWATRLSTPPNASASVKHLRAFTNRSTESIPPCSSKLTIAPKPSCWDAATLWPGCDVSPG